MLHAIREKSAATASVAEFFASDGVTYGHIFPSSSESPPDAIGRLVPVKVDGARVL